MCRSTFRAETQGCCYAMEAGVVMRALIAEILGMKQKHDLDWESNCAKAKKHLWLTDCQSLRDYCVNPTAAAPEDKRLEIDLEGLREYLWEYPDGSLKDYVTEDEHDRIRWIDTSTMLCDPLTKAGGKTFADRLINCMQSGDLDLTPTVESQMRKMKQKKGREAAVEKKRQHKELGDWPGSIKKCVQLLEGVEEAPVEDASFELGEDDFTFYEG